MTGTADFLLAGMAGVLPVLLKGLAIGFLAAAPTGPSGVLVIKRTLEKGRWTGFVTGLGVTVSDMLYVFCSSVGLGFVMDMVNDGRTSFACSLVGCALLMGFGVFTLVNNPLKKLRNAGGSSHGTLSGWLSGFIVAVVNPMVIVIYMSLFAYLNMQPGALEGGARLVGYGSVLLGDVCWWLFLSGLISALRNRFDLKGIWVINRILGCVLVAASLGWLAYTLAVG